MKQMMVVLGLLVILTSCAAIPESVANEVTWLTPEEIDRIDMAITYGCANAIARIETDQIENTLPICVDHFWKFFQYHKGETWPDDSHISSLSLWVINDWSSIGVKTFAETYGCNNNGCHISVNCFPAGEIWKSLQEEMVKQGKELSK